MTISACFAGLGNRSLLAGAMTLALVSLAGILAGFFGKFYLFGTSPGAEQPALYRRGPCRLRLGGPCPSLLLNIIRAMYWPTAGLQVDRPVSVPMAVRIGLAACLRHFGRRNSSRVALIGLALRPSPIWHSCSDDASSRAHHAAAH